MRTSQHKRLVRLAGLMVLSLLVAVTGVQAAQARLNEPSGPVAKTASSQLPSAAQVAQHKGIAASAQSLSGPQLPSAAQVAQHKGTAASAQSLSGPQLPSAAQVAQHAGIAASAPRVTAVTARAGTQGRGGVASVPYATATGAAPVSSGRSSTTAWIVGGSAALIVVIGAWALIRRRRQSGELASATYCAQHPEDPMCQAA